MELNHVLRRWFFDWKDVVRKYWLERRSNELGRFIFFFVSDLKAKRFYNFFPEGKWLVGCWNTLAWKLQGLGVTTTRGLKEIYALAFPP